jgi:predicted ABC-type ATPase
VIGGVNGAGKSTYASVPGSRSFTGGVEAINPDEKTQATLKKYAALDLGTDAANLLAVTLAESMVWEALARRASVAVETVFSTTKYFEAAHVARELGHRVALVYIGLFNVEQSIERVALRVLGGGHDVPQEKIRARWPRSLQNFVDFIPLADDVLLLSNAGTEVVIVGTREQGGNFTLHRPDALPEITALLRGAAA